MEGYDQCGAPPFPHIGPANSSDLSAKLASLPYSLMEQEEISPGLQEIRLQGYKSVKEWKVPTPLSTKFVPFVTVGLINPLAATKGRAGAGNRMMDLYNPRCCFQEFILRTDWDKGAKTDAQEESLQCFCQGHGPLLIHRNPKI